MHKSILFSVFLLLTAIGLTQEFRQNYIQYSSSGLNSDSGADIIDLDGYGQLDVLMGFESRADLTFHKNNGSVYTPTFLLDTMTGYTFVQTVDFDLDGDDDFLLGANYSGSNGLFLYTNDGSNNYSSLWMGNTTEHIQMAVAVDIDNDGDLDVVVDVVGNDSAIWFYRNNGDDTFDSSFENLGNGSVLYGVADLNENGIKDILACHYDFGEAAYRVLALEHDGDLNFIEHELGYTDYKPTGLTADFFGSELPDLIQGPHSGSADAFMWENIGDFNFNFIGTVETSNNGWIAIAHDYDGDGDLDFWSSGVSPNFSLQRNNGNGTFTSVDFSNLAIGVPLDYVDMDGDGLRDLVMHDGRGKIEVLTQTENNLFNSTYINFNPVNGFLCVADYNGDGREDIIASSYNRIGFMPQNFFQIVDAISWHDLDEDNLAEYTNLDDMIQYDREGDGDMDILVYVNQYAYWLVNNNGVFEEELISDDVGGWKIEVDDIDDDGYADVLVYNSPITRIEYNGTNYTTSTINEGSPRFEPLDMDLDGDKDIVYLSWNSPEAELRLIVNNGNTFSDGLLMVIPEINSSFFNVNNKVEVEGNDIDNDGDEDLFIMSPDQDFVLWLEHNADGTFTTHSLSDDINRPTHISFADVDVDGTTDVLISALDDRDIIIFRNNGDGSFAQEILWQDYSAPTRHYPVDFDNDGDLDIVYSGFTDYKLAWLENTTIDCLPSFVVNSAQICSGDSLLVGEEYVLEPGVYEQTYLNALGCDSLVALQLDHYEVIENLSVANNDNVLSISTDYTDYQWFLNGELLTNETENSVDATLYGSGDYYAYATDENGCEVVSTVLTITIIGVTELDKIQMGFLYPNPSSGLVNFRSNNSTNRRITIFNALGAEVHSVTVLANNLTMDLSLLNSGIYFYVVQTSEGSYTERLIIKVEE